MRQIYLDYAATTPVDPRVAAKMQQCLTAEGVFGNPASRHAYGQEASERIEKARLDIATTIHAEAKEIIFTSGATESINLALKGAAASYQRKGKHIITMKTEHKAGLDACQFLEKEGYEVTYLLPEKNGLLDIDKFRSVLRPDTILVSIMLVNNETGVIQDLKTISDITSHQSILLHVDAAQAIGKQHVDVSQWPIDLMSLSAHKVYGPKGIGALYLRSKPRVRVSPLLHGGGHEQGMRSGTLPTHQIVGMGEAFALATLEHATEYSRICELRDAFLKGIQTISRCELNTDLACCVPHILNIRFEGMIADAILASASALAASTASACQGKGIEGSYVLRAMGYSDEQVKSSLRFSFGRFTTMSEIEDAVQVLRLSS